MKTGSTKFNASGVGVCRATVEDAAVIAALHSETFKRGWDQQFVRDLLQSGYGIGFLITSREDVTATGFALARQVGEDCELLSIAVKEPNRRCGAAFALLGRLVQHVQDAGIQRIFLEVAGENTAAIALYERSGFEVSGHRKGYYPREDGTACDALVLTLALDGRRP